MIRRKRTRTHFIAVLIVVNVLVLAPVEGTLFGLSKMNGCDSTSRTGGTADRRLFDGAVSSCPLLSFATEVPVSDCTEERYAFNLLSS